MLHLQPTLSLLSALSAACQASQQQCGTLNLPQLKFWDHQSFLSTGHHSAKAMPHHSAYNPENTDCSQHKESTRCVDSGSEEDNQRKYLMSLHASCPGSKLYLDDDHMQHSDVSSIYRGAIYQRCAACLCLLPVTIQSVGASYTRLELSCHLNPRTAMS